MATGLNRELTLGCAADTGPKRRASVASLRGLVGGGPLVLPAGTPPPSPRSGAKVLGEWVILV